MPVETESPEVLSPFPPPAVSAPIVLSGGQEQGREAGGAPGSLALLSFGEARGRNSLFNILTCLTLAE